MKRTSQLPHSHPLTPRRLALLVAAALSGGSACADLDRGPRLPTAVELAGLPITFERNQGQYPADVLFVSRGLRGTLALRSGEVAITPRRDRPAYGEPLRLRLGGANLAPEVEAARPLAARSHHYRGNAAAGRIENVPHFGELQLKDVYPGIDMVLHGREGALEYDFVVAPRADPADIRLDLRGVDHASLDSHGNLLMARGDERLTQQAPVAFQHAGTQRRVVEARFELVEGEQGREARFVLGDYDRTAPLTIDPTIAYSTFVGSSGGDGGTIVRVDAAGDLSFTQLGASGSVDPVMVTKLDPDTNTLVYQTSFGGHGFSTANDLALGGAGSTTAYVTGSTRAFDFPVAPPKSDLTEDAFVAVLAPSGALVDTKLIGGSGGSDAGHAIQVDGGGNVFVAGRTNSLDFAVTAGPPLLNTIGASGFADGFVAKLDPSLGTTYLRFLGGSGSDAIDGLAIDPAGQAIVAGSTTSHDFPQVNVGAPASPPPLAPFQLRGFVAKLSPDGAALVYSQYIGGASFTADAVAYDSTTGDAIVAGSIGNNTLVPTPARAFSGGFDAYVVRVSPAGTPTYSTYLGGAGNDLPDAVAVNSAGDIYVTGVTRSANFPIDRALPGHRRLSGPSDAFLTRLRRGSIDFSSYLGGASEDRGSSIANGPDGSVWVGGMTHSPDFPTRRAWRDFLFGPSDGFITRINGLRPRGPPED